MTDKLATTTTQEEYSREQIELIKTTVARDCTDPELQLFLYTARTRHLDPLLRQIYAVKRKTKHGDIMTIQVGIDGFRRMAERTKVYAGSDDAVFDNENNPAKATVTVWRMVEGHRCPFTATARWDEYFPGPPQDFMWKKMPCTMLGKCAEALALRKAFPNDLGGLYIPEEMAQAGSTTMEEGATAYENKYADVIAKAENQVIPEQVSASAVSELRTRVIEAAANPMPDRRVASIDQPFRRRGSDPVKSDPTFGEGADGPMIAGTITRVSNPKDSVKGSPFIVVSFGSESFWCYNEGLLMYFGPNCVGKFCSFSYTSKNPKFRNVGKMYQMGDTEFDNNLPVIDLNAEGAMATVGEEADIF